QRAIGARTFANLGADGLLALRDEDDRHLTLAVGARTFTYKPDGAFDWTGPAVSLRLDLALWQSAATTSSLELAGVIGIDLRAYAGKAFADACAKDQPPAPACFAPTTRARHDRYHRAGLELTWTGSVVATLGYQLVAIDSNSYGQSLIRHRVQASTTIDLTHKIYATVFGILQLEQYLDGLVVQTDPDQQSFTSLEDENRSSISLRLGRPITAAWSVEARLAYWRNLGGSDNAFERGLAYVGAIYAR
ncbi:MAG: hypothetical protein NT062_33110, partial [Proteobacteria bacterium]|nr:hypothetical protein [Pseudomonadota bacterium]